MKNNYFFPDFLGDFMRKIDMRTQLEASMMSMTLILIGMLVSVFYFVVYFDFALWYKIVLVINGLAGFVFLSSFLVTAFQQYQSYLTAIEFQQETKHMKGGMQKNAKEN
jgi:hypothetical protein